MQSEPDTKISSSISVFSRILFISSKEAVAILAIPVILIGFSIFQETVLYFMGIIGISLMGYTLAPLFHKIFSKIEKKHEG